MTNADFNKMSPAERIEMWEGEGGSIDQPDGFGEASGNLCPHCGDIMPEDGTPCPACRHITPIDPHCSTVEGCASCGSVGPERWNLPEDGTQVCGECWLEEGERSAKRQTRPKASGPPLGQHVRPNLSSVLTETTGNLKASVLGGTRGDLDALGAICHPEQRPAVPLGMLGLLPHKKDWHSTCLMCGHIHYDTKIAKCARCGGLCTGRSSEDLMLLERRLLSSNAIM